CLELLDRRADGGLHRVRASLRAPCVLHGRGELALQLQNPRGIDARCKLSGGGEQLVLERRELFLVLSVQALREILECAHRLLARLALEKACVREIEERGRGRETLGGARPENLSRLIEHEHRRQGAVEAQTTHRENTALFRTLER